MRRWVTSATLKTTLAWGRRGRQTSREVSPQTGLGLCLPPGIDTAFESTVRTGFLLSSCVCASKKACAGGRARGMRQNLSAKETSGNQGGHHEEPLARIDRLHGGFG